MEYVIAAHTLNSSVGVCQTCRAAMARTSSSCFIACSAPTPTVAACCCASTISRPRRCASSSASALPGRGRGRDAAALGFGAGVRAGELGSGGSVASKAS